jgi:probable HAF family extracellular repeat protein
MVALGDLPGGYFSSNASAVSADGEVVVGVSAVENGSEAFRWAEATGIVGLGYLVNEFRWSEATGVTADGSTVVGFAVVDAVVRSEGEFEQITNAAFIWDTDHGMRDLKTVLETEHELDLAGWQLTSAVDISDDGLVIAGNGINPQGQVEGWVVRLEAIPEPATVALVIAATVCLATAVRRLRIHG